MKDFCDGVRLLSLLDMGIRNLEKNSELINSFDSYPISNYDAGSKLIKALRFSFEKLTRDNRENNFSNLMGFFSENVILSSEGFLGILFGNFLFSFSNALNEKDRVFSSDFVKGFEKAYLDIFVNLLSPKEETVLYSLKVVNESFNNNYSDNISLKELFAMSFRDLNKNLALAIENSSSKANFIDAGSIAFFIFLEGMVSYLELKPLTSLNADFFKSFSPKMNIYNDTFCINYCIKKVEDVDSLKKSLKDAGNDPIIYLSKDNFIKIHIHSMDPKKVFDRTSRFGKPLNIKICDSFSSNVIGDKKI